MRRHVKRKDIEAFTIVEMMTAAVVAGFVGVAVFSMTDTGMMMTARNLSENLTNNHERKSLDRVEEVIQQAYTMPVLVNTSGAAASSPAAGVSFDYFVGSPYVLTVSGSSLLSSTTSLTLVRSTNAVVWAPVPSVGDVVMINGAPSTVRARITSVVVGSTNGSAQQTITVNLASALGSAVSVPSSGILTAALVHKVAFIVMPEGSGYELHYYPSYETTSNLNDPTQYIMLSDQIGLNTPDPTPFTLSQIESTNFVTLSLRVRSSVYDQRLSTKQADQFNTYARLDAYIRPKINPQ